MATIKKNFFAARQFGSAPYGNLSTFAFKLATAANGSTLESNSVAPIGNGDKVILGELPAGMSLQDFLARVSTAFTALVTGDIGFEYQDGVDDATAPQKADYFANDLTLHTAGVYRLATTYAPVVLPKPAYLTLTTAGAANAKAARVDLFVVGELTGDK